MTMAEELSEQKKAELRHVADITWEGILAAHEKFLKVQAEEAARASGT
jgi:hypothetical protein